MHKPDSRRFSRFAALLGVILAALVGTVVTAPVASAVEISTNYPEVSVQAGQNVTLDLALSSTAAERVALAVTKSPPDWTTSLQGGGFTIGAVDVTPDAAPATQLHVQVPGDAKPGSYDIVVTATAPSGTKELPITLEVTTQPSDAFTLTSEFDQLQGAPTDTFSFSLNLANNTGTTATFGLTAQGPAGWTVTAAPASQGKASAVEVDAGASQSITVTAKAPTGVSGGTYPIEVTAASQGTTLTTKLAVEVVGTPDLSMSTADQVLNAAGSAGKATEVHLTLTNTGSAPLDGVTLSATPPSNWKVTFSPSTVDTIAAGKTASVVATVTPSGDAITGDYQLTLSANATSTSSSVDIRYTVETSTWWGLVGIVIIAAAVVALLWLFRRFGRR